MDTKENGQHDAWTHELPFRPGMAMLLNVGKFHYVENNSTEPRIHIIVDGPIRFSEEMLITLARKQNNVSSFRELAGRVVCSRALRGYSLEESRFHINFAKSLGVEPKAIHNDLEIILLEPANSVLADRAELINMTTAGLLHLRGFCTRRPYWIRTARFID